MLATMPTDLSLPAATIPPHHRTAPWLYAVGVAAPLAAVAVVTLLGADPKWTLRDPAGAGGLPPYAGFFSNLGVLAWWAAAVACVLAALVVRWGQNRRDSLADAAAAGGGLSAVLALDDLLLVHEALLPLYVGLDERWALAAYGTGALAYLWRFRAVHLRMETGLMAASIALLAASLVVDLMELDGAKALLLEDGAKFGGICAWALYHLRLAWTLLAGRA
ncbi:hypothetical protein HHL28_13875 [Aerophototrophica crusticola]|uniref:DUF998 domain-containing protein n=1 Tax=Aerophototrophica crusticola TaxID=1709002 RepID=A0A858R999_9PROT|nr:hypothetical protein HHL28_13875 [Rhodospirillaceae bacterium B3]